MLEIRVEEEKKEEEERRIQYGNDLMTNELAIWHVSIIQVSGPLIE